MKKTLTLMVSLLMLTAVSRAENLQKFYEKYGADERFEYVVIDKDMMNLGELLGDKSKSDGKELDKLQDLKILTISCDTEQDFIIAMMAELDEIVKSGGFESALEVREKGERVNICFRVQETDNSDMLIIAQEKNEFTCVWIKGVISKEDLMNIVSMTTKEVTE